MCRRTSIAHFLLLQGFRCSVRKAPINQVSKVYLILILLIVAAIYGPSIWVRWVMHRHSKHIDEIPGNGYELAQHLIDRFELNNTQVEEGRKDENHFNPNDSMVRLSPDIYSGKSLTAIAIAANEVGHAIQYHRREKLILWRSQTLPKMAILEKISMAFLMLIPVVGAATRTPLLMGFMFLLLIAFMFSRIVFHLSTLPVEWDASFNKALPILIEGNYVPESNLPAVRQVLKAAALTYVAAALADLFSFWRWIRFLR
jgi:Zn-dependent membrane protease YugP